MESIRNFLGLPDSYYNCSAKTPEQWLETGEKWPILGHLLMILGTIYAILYVPTIYAMFRLNLVRNDCYKIMICLILADIGNLSSNSFVAGYVFATGAVFCSFPVFSYLVGGWNFLIWAIASYFYILLAVNRLVIVLENPRLSHIFNKIPIQLWIVAGIIYGVWCGVYTPPVIFNSRFFSAIYVPAIEPLEKEFPMYVNKWHPYHNLGIGILLFILYGLIILLLQRKRETRRISKGEMSALIQAVMITIPAMVASCLYVYIQFFNAATLAMAITAHFAWQTTTGVSAMIYLTLNRSIRGFYRGNRGVASTNKEHSQKDSKGIIE